VGPPSGTSIGLGVGPPLIGYGMSHAIITWEIIRFSLT